MRRALAALALALLGGACTSVVRYTNELVSDDHGRTYLTRVPSAFGGTALSCTKTVRPSSTLMNPKPFV